MQDQKTLRGIDPHKISPWLAEHLPDCTPPFSFSLIAAGGSNLSYCVRDAAHRRWVLRRGPESARLATAHDMQREWRVLSALADTPCAVPVPACMALCTDSSVCDSDFYLMEFVDGRILRNHRDASDMSPEQCVQATRSLLEVQAEMHTMDFAAAGLADLSPGHDDYVERQLHRWRKQATLSAERELPLLEDLYLRLLHDNPGPQAPPALVHGDYRFDNTVLNDEMRLVAVLDWELCAIGDPVADFFWSCIYWAAPEGERDVFVDSPSRHAGFPERRWLIEEYAAHTGFDLAAENYFLAFGRWKMACIIEGVYARLRKGAGGGMQTDSQMNIASMVDNLLNEALQDLERL